MPKKPIEVKGKFGKLEVLHCNLPPRKRVLVKCECGKEFATTSYDLLSGRTSSCGSTLCSTRSYDLTGKQFGYLFVEKLSAAKNNRNELIWICKCICGKKRKVKTDNLLNGRVQSCGCQKDILKSKKLKKPIKDNLIVILYNQYKIGAKNRDLEFNLTKDQIRDFVFSNCHYCGSEPLGTHTIKYITGDEYIKYNGIDRVDSSIGYSINNCVTCCKICNAAKSDRSVSDFLNWVHKLVNYQNGN